MSTTAASALPSAHHRRTPAGVLVEWDPTVGAGECGGSDLLSGLWPGHRGEVLLLDLSGLHLVTAEGIESLLRAVATLAGRGFDVRLCDPQPLVRTALFLTGVPGGATVYDDVPGAAVGHSRDRVDDRGYL